MGADIHSFAEVRTNNKWEKVTNPVFDIGNEYSSPISAPFNSRSYSIFGFLADVRNYSHCTPISECKGLPRDSEYLNTASSYGDYATDMYFGQPIPIEDRAKVYTDIMYDANYHSHSWLTLEELLAFDYEQKFWNRRITRQTGPNSFNGASEGEGTMETCREHLGEWFFKELEVLKSLGKPEDVRIVFWFDN